jgi:dienelactone hydrolase
VNGRSLPAFTRIRPATQKIESGGENTMEQLPTRETFLSLLGKIPPQPPLDARLLAEQTFETHTQKLIEYTVAHDEKVQAYLLVPAGIKKPRPGILAVHQDGDRRPYQYGGSEPAGVAGDPDLPYGLELCLRGYVVICPDRFPFGSRSLANSKFQETFNQFRVFTRFQGPELELTEDLYRGSVANLTLTEGSTYLGVELSELGRAVDYLCSLPEVDSNRLGVIGHSAGGFMGAVYMYTDPRIKVGCASCGTFLLDWIYGRDRLRPMNGFGSLIVVPGLKAWGDFDDVLAGLAPRPYLETHSDLPQEMLDTKSKKARQRYAELGVPERYHSSTYLANVHIFRADMREKSYAWFDRWLAGGEV